MPCLAFAIACTSCLLIVHGRPSNANETVQYEMDIVLGTGYLVKAPSPPRPSIGLQKSMMLVTPAVLAAAGWAMGSQVILGHCQNLIFPGDAEDHGVLNGCNVARRFWYLLIVFIVFGLSRARQTRQWRKGASNGIQSNCGTTGSRKRVLEWTRRPGYAQGVLRQKLVLQSTRTFWHGGEYSWWVCQDSNHRSVQQQRQAVEDNISTVKISTEQITEPRSVKASIDVTDTTAFCRISEEEEEEYWHRHTPRCSDMMFHDATESANERTAANAAIQVAHRQTAAKPAVYSHASSATTPRQNAKSVTFASNSFTPVKIPESTTSEVPLGTALPSQARSSNNRLKLVGAPKDRIRAIVDQLSRNQL